MAGRVVIIASAEKQHLHKQKIQYMSLASITFALKTSSQKWSEIEQTKAFPGIWGSEGSFATGTVSSVACPLESTVK